MSDELNKARRAFRTTLLTVSGLPAARGWQDDVFRPQVGTAYVTEQFAQVSRRRISLGDPVTLRHEFRATVTLHYPREVGATSNLAAAEIVAGRICDTFKPGRSMTADGFSIKVDLSEPRAALPGDSAWFGVPVIILLYGWSVTS